MLKFNSKVKRQNSKGESLRLHLFAALRENSAGSSKQTEKTYNLKLITSNLIAP
jgi:hypothetical protein